MKISQILKKYYNHIERIDAQILLAHVLQKPREFLITHEHEPISFLNKIKFNRLVNKRKAGVPIAYLTGHKEFFGLDFLVNKHTLVPRPDTEILVETAVSHIMNHITHSTYHVSIDNMLLIDIGTGSGCIPIAINTTIKQYNNKTIPTYAIDISKPALRIAKKNAQKHTVDMRFLHGNLLSPLIQRWNNITITANLPYLTEEQFQTEPSIQHEPKSALVADKEGLALYEELLKQVKLICDTWYVMRSITCFFEIDPDQTEGIKKLINNHLPNAGIKIIKDLSGFDRVVEIMYPR